MGNKTIAKITNLIKNGRRIPERWIEGEILYIYKNMGDAGKCGNYRPIFIAPIIYNIWPGLTRGELAKIAHILTSRKQYGFIEGISTTDAIVKVEQYIEQTDCEERVLLIDLSKAFGATSRTLPRTTLYKKGLPEEIIRHIRKGHRWARLSPEYSGRYGATEEDNIEVFQG